METPGETASVSSMVAHAGVRSPPKPARGSLVRLSPAPACRGAFLLTAVDVQGCPLGPGTHRRTVSPEHWRTVQSVQGLEAPVGGRGGRHGAQAKREARVRQSVLLPAHQPVPAGSLPAPAASCAQFPSPLSAHLVVLVTSLWFLDLGLLDPECHLWQHSLGRASHF